MRGQASGMANQMREVKQKLKVETDMQRKIMLDIKTKHDAIIRLEARQKLIQQAIKV